MSKPHQVYRNWIESASAMSGAQPSMPQVSSTHSQGHLDNTEDPALRELDIALGLVSESDGGSVLSTEKTKQCSTPVPSQHGVIDNDDIQESVTGVYVEKQIHGVSLNRNVSHKQNYNSDDLLPKKLAMLDPKSPGKKLLNHRHGQGSYGAYQHSHQQRYVKVYGHSFAQGSQEILQAGIACSPGGEKAQSTEPERGQSAGEEHEISHAARAHNGVEEVQAQCSALMDSSGQSGYRVQRIFPPSDTTNIRRKYPGKDSLFQEDTPGLQKDDQQVAEDIPAHPRQGAVARLHRGSDGNVRPTSATRIRQTITKPTSRTSAKSARQTIVKPLRHTSAKQARPTSNLREHKRRATGARQKSKSRAHKARSSRVTWATAPSGNEGSVHREVQERTARGAHTSFSRSTQSLTGAEQTRSGGLGLAVIYAYHSISPSVLHGYSDSNVHLYPVFCQCTKQEQGYHLFADFYRRTYQGYGHLHHGELCPHHIQILGLVAHQAHFVSQTGHFQVCHPASGTY